MHRALGLVLLGVALGTHHGIVRLGPGDEPPARLKLQVGDRELVVHDGKPFDCDFGGGSVRCTITRESTRVLELGTLRVEYPEGMGFDHHSRPNTETWTLDALDGSAQLHRMPASLATEGTLDDMVARVAKGMHADGAIERCSLDDGRWPGRRFVHVVGTVEQEVAWYLLGRSGADAWFFSTGHSVTMNEAESAQWTTLLATVARTLELGPKKGGERSRR